MTSSLPLLDQIQIGTPCKADWNAMRGDDRVRHCGLCKLDVYNLGAMSPSEAEALVAGASGRLCARFARREDGTVVTQDCGPVRRRIQRRIRRVRAAAAALFGLVSTFALSACGREPADTAKAPPAPKETPQLPPEITPELMGDVAYPQELGRICPPKAVQAQPETAKPDAPKKP